MAAFFASSLPYLYGFSRQKAESIFLGRSVVNSADTYVYLSNIISVKDGQIVVPNLYTTESREPFLIKPTYIIVGIIAELSGTSPLLLYHLARLVSAIAFVIILWKFIGLFVKREAERLFALVIVLSSSGLGFLLHRYFPASIDTWVPESNTFFSLIEAPHFIITQTLLLGSIMLILKFIDIRKWKYLVFASVLTTLVILEHPFMLPFVFLFPASLFFMFIKTDKISEKFGPLIKFFILPIIAVLVIYRFSFLTVSGRLMNSQNILTTPSFENIISGYGLLLPLAILGFFNSNFKKRENSILAVWIVLSFILIYMPFSFQRRLLEGVHIPISIMAAGGILFIFSRMKTKLGKYIFLTAAIIVLSLTNINNVNIMIEAFGKDAGEQLIYYIDRDEYEGMKWLSSHSNAGDAILANAYYSNILPGITGRFVYLGHRIQTYKPILKQHYFDQFMQASNTVYRQKFLKENGINYIFFGKNDPYNQFRKSIEILGSVKIAWSKNGVEILKVY